MDRQQLAILGAGAGLGAALMYALDPDRGKRRRAGVRDKLVSATDKAADAMSATARDLSNRARGLQGGTRRLGDRFELMQENWSPTARLLTGAAGGAAIVYGLIRRNPMCLLVGTVGAGLLLRGLTNLELKRLTGISAGRRAVEIQKDINIAAPVEQVYEFWSNVQNFPMFMTNVQEVRATADGGSHWKVKGPAGVPVEWDAIITEQIPNKLLAWKSVEGSSVANAGIVRFDRNDDGTTRLEVKLSYNPPGGAMGHALAALLGADPKRQMDEDLVRMKTLIETGNPPHDAARPEPTQLRDAMVH